MDEIRNRVKESGLITVDLEIFKPKGTIREIDIADQLWQGIALKEKDFRQWIKDHDWDQYNDASVYIHCSADAIVPTWAFMLVSSMVTPIAQTALVGDRADLEKLMIKNAIAAYDISEMKDGRIIIKGCSDIESPAYAMVELMKRLQPVAKSIMYGEPCSAVPVFKRR
jgi:hypothetical protein